MSIAQDIAALIDYGLSQNLLDQADTYYARHRLMQLLKVFEVSEADEKLVFGEVQTVLDRICDDMVSRGLVGDNTLERDQLDSTIMDCLMPLPSQVVQRFKNHYQVSAKAATDDYYHLSRGSNYVRVERIAQNLTWQYDSAFGVLDITINLSKPEKDPVAIAAERAAVSVAYPKCLLCRENEGYGTRLNHPARQNLRLIPLTLNQTENWFLQYSPYEYYNEHCIVLKAEHEPMQISKMTFTRLLDFVEMFPHYFIGSNADLPIVGGSILSHEHFQGGCFEFAMARAKINFEKQFEQLPQVRLQTLFWPLSVIRLSSDNREALERAAGIVLSNWRSYTDEQVDLYAFTDSIMHNTITPIARYRSGYFELDLVLRNNRTTTEHPLGLFHPHEQWHHIKKENIGLIEVLGLAILPERLEGALHVLSMCLQGQAQLEDYPQYLIHQAWLDELRPQFVHGENAQLFLKNAIGAVFEHVLRDAGVFKQDEMGQGAMLRFVEQLELK